MTKGNEMAFPILDPTSGACDTGLTKREYFAIQVLNGILSDLNYIKFIIALANEEGISNSEAATLTAVDFADCLINVLNNTNEIKGD